MSTPDADGQPAPDGPAEDGPGTGPLNTVRGLLAAATQRLLGDTITLDDDGWRAPSRLPGWSRGHVASHLARNAEGMTRLATWARTGERQEMYPSREQRDADIDAGAGRSGLDLQVDLDTTAGALDAALAALADADRWDAAIEIRGEPQPARLLPLLRLSEVALHHVDLDVGTELADLDPELVGWLLELVALRLHNREDYPALELRTDAGHHAVLGRPDATPTVVGGPDAAVLGRLTGRTTAGSADGVSGLDGIELPAFA